MGLLRQVASELRHQPGRFAAMLAAIVVSVAFLAASQVLLATESSALGQRTVLYASRADVVVTSHLWHWPRGREQRDNAVRDATAFLRQDPRVTAVAAFSQVRSQVLVGERIHDVMLTTSLPDASLRWYEADEGRLPETVAEVVLTRETADGLGVRVGDQVQLNLVESAALTVVGITHQRGYETAPAYVVDSLINQVDESLPPADYRILINPRDTARDTPGASSGGVGRMLLVKTANPADAEAVRADTQTALDQKGWMKIIIRPHLGTALIADAVAAQGQGGWTGQLVTGSAAISLLVGALIIANTFAILLAQRRRQIGLLRAVGASRGQVLGRYLGEAFALGVVGALIGVPLALASAAAVSRWVTHSWGFGLVVPWERVALVALLGVLATVLAAVVPVVRASRATPLEALQPVVSGGKALRRNRARALACGVAVLGGAVLLGLALAAREVPFGGDRLVIAVVGGLVLSVGVLVATPLYVPALVRWVGAPLVGRRPELRVAVLNAGRNPGRAGATASALMLAVALIVLVQVGAASARASAFVALDERHPVDLGLQASVLAPDLLDPQGSGPATNRDRAGRLRGFKPSALSQVRHTNGVAAAVMVPTSEPAVLFTGAGVYDQMPVAPLTDEALTVLRHPVEISRDQVGVSAEAMGRLRLTEGMQMIIFAPGGPSRSLTVLEANIGPRLVMVTPEIFEGLFDQTRPGLILTRLTDPDNSDAVVRELTARLMWSNAGLDISGSAEQKTVLRNLLDDLTAIMTGLLAVAAVVALVGVGNTLGLSVLERTRENALLRALGVPASGLRWMLLVEALLLSLVAVAVGLVFGVLFGWVGAMVVLRQFDMPAPQLQVDPVALLATGLVVVAAGALASVLPGRRAARSSPVEAMADVG